MENKIIAVDFDGTLCVDALPGIGEPRWRVIDYLNKQKKSGAKLILWTCRTGKKLQEAVVWCRERGITFDAINENLKEVIEFFGGDSRKILADEYIDDKAIPISSAADLAIGDENRKTVVLDKDLETMLISAMRYALGRRSYMVSLTVGFLIPLLPQLSDWCLNVMIRDLVEEYTLAARVTSYSPLGDPCDVAEWDRMKEALVAEREKRDA